MTQQIYFAISILVEFQTVTVSECCLIKLLPCVLFEKCIYISALEMASPMNQHCANCIGTLSFPVASNWSATCQKPALDMTRTYNHVSQPFQYKSNF